MARCPHGMAFVGAACSRAGSWKHLPVCSMVLEFRRQHSVYFMRCLVSQRLRVASVLFSVHYLVLEFFWRLFGDHEPTGPKYSVNIACYSTARMPLGRRNKNGTPRRESRGTCSDPFSLFANEIHSELVAVFVNAQFMTFW